MIILGCAIIYFGVEELPRYVVYVKEQSVAQHKQLLRRRIQSIHDSPALPLP